ADALDVVLVEPHDRDHPDVLARGLRHHAAALLDEKQRGLPGDRAGGGERRDLTEAVPRGDAHVLQAVALAPHLVRRPAHGHHAGLDHVRSVQRLDRTLEAELPNWHLEDLLRALEHAARGGVAVVEVLAHARLLHALAGEQQRDRTVESYTHV